MVSHVELSLTGAMGSFLGGDTRRFMVNPPAGGPEADAKEIGLHLVLTRQRWEDMARACLHRFCGLGEGGLGMKRWKLVRPKQKKLKASSWKMA